MYEGEVMQNLVIHVQPRGRHNSKRRVTVSNKPLECRKVGGNNNNPHQQHPVESNTHITNNNNSSSSNNNKKDVTAAKKEKSSLRHSHHPQQAANGSSAHGKGSTNGSAASARGAGGNHHGGHNDNGRRTTVTRERSFMRPHQQLHYSNSSGGGGPQHHQEVRDAAAAGAPSGGPRAVTVQRQRSCVANLYGSHGRSNSAAAMPAATAAAYQRPKPAMQLYRPPTLRVSDDYTMMNGSYAYDVSNGSDYSSSLNKPGLNINAKEFVSLSSNGSYVSNAGGGGSNGIHSSNTVSFSGPNGLTPSALKHSKSSSQVSNGRTNGTAAAGGGLHHSRSSSVYFGGHQAGASVSKASTKDGRNGNSGGSMAGSSPPLRVHFTDDTITYDPDNKVGMIQRSPTTTGNLLSTAPQIIPIKRSKSLGSAADLNNHPTTVVVGGHPAPGLLHSPVESAAANAINEMAPFNDDVTKKLQNVLQFPNSASARVVMEVVRQLFHKLVQGSKYAEPAARYCIAVIEKENGGETFLETLLNTCQEYYQERDRLLRPAPSAPTRPGTAPQTHTRWVSYMTFLHEMYTQVKRRQRTVVSSAGPGLLLLTLLAECCVVSLDDQAKGGASMAQTECLFFILTGVGKDIEVELPPLMSKVMGAARDALFSSARAPAVRKTLLQLIEMNAASWQLPAPAVMYYYPGVGGK